MEGPASLDIKRHDGRTEQIDLARIPFVIGRKGADLDLADASVSRKHCKIDASADGWIVRDLGSSNGTFLNGNRVEEHGLSEGDRLVLGRTELTFHAGAVPGPSPESRGKPGLEDARLWSVIELGVTAGKEPEWLAHFLESVAKKFRAERSFIVEYDETGGVGRPVAGIAPDFNAEGPGGDVPLSRTIVDQVIRERRPVVTTNAEVDRRFAEAQSVDRYEIRTVVCAPVRWQGQAVGAIYIERHHEEKPYGEEDGEELQDFADLLGVAMMAWRGHSIEHRQEWERELLARTFSEERIAEMIEKGGMQSVKREVKEACIVKLSLRGLQAAFGKGSDETWRAISQIIAQVNDILRRHGGAVIRDGCAVFEGGEGPEGGYAVEGAKAAAEMQQAIRPGVKRIMRELQAGIAATVGVSCGEVLVGFFGAGQQMDYHALGEPVTIATALSMHAHDGEVLIDHTTYNRVRLFMNAQRIAPISVPGVEQQVQLYRVMPY